ncbi:MAG: hypothetical protein ACC608_00650 [Anaerofustis sp.]
MTKDELLNRINEEKLDAYHCNIDYGVINDDEIGIIKQNGRYQIYMSNERGGIHITDECATEGDAFDEIYTFLKAKKNVDG